MSVTYKVEVDSCETCPGAIREQHGIFRCKHNTEITFRQNQDMGVPAACPMRAPVKVWVFAWGGQQLHICLTRESSVARWEELRNKQVALIQAVYESVKELEKRDAELLDQIAAFRAMEYPGAELVIE
jgi:hypothetical protein